MCKPVKIDVWTNAAVFTMFARHAGKSSQILKILYNKLLLNSIKCPGKSQKCLAKIKENSVNTDNTQCR